MSGLLKWLRQRRINRLLVKRAGLIARKQAHHDAEKISPDTYEELGRVEERLRQLTGERVPS